MTGRPAQSGSPAHPQASTLPALLRFGSCFGRLVSQRPEYAEAVGTVFGAELQPFGAHLADGLHFDLLITDAEPMDPLAAALPDPAKGMRLQGNDRHAIIVTEVLLAEVRLDSIPAQARLTVRHPGVSWFELRVHIDVVLNKMLFLLDRVVVHAAAVLLDGMVYLFVGQKGAGKSTLCLGLARAGGTVLGEDRAILRRSPSGFLISGADERSRLTERTERHFFPEQLAVAAQDFAGTLKKEIRMGDFFRSRPYEDFPVHRLLFPRITGTLALRRLTAQRALLSLMQSTAQFQRFAGPTDQEGFLNFLAAFIGTVPSYELTLSEELGDLERLAADLPRA